MVDGPGWEMFDGLPRTSASPSNILHPTSNIAMSPEEYERIKASEKAHLLEMRRLKGLAADAARKGRLASALDGITGSLSAGDAERESTARRLLEDAARSEARFDLAVDAQNEAAERAAKANEAAAFEAQTEADQMAARARAAVEAMRASMGPAAPASPDALPPVPSEGKTFGRTPEADEAAPPVAPGKTFGRA